LNKKEENDKITEEWREMMKETTLCYIEKDNQYLMLYRNKKENDPNEGKWIGVGGKLEKGETPQQCVVREVLEETGLLLTEYQYRGIIHFKSDMWEDEEMYLYTATSFDGELIDECSEGHLAWVPIDEVMHLNTWAGDKIFLKKLLEGEYNIDLTVCYKGDELIDVR